METKFSVKNLCCLLAFLVSAVLSETRGQWTDTFDSLSSAWRGDISSFHVDSGFLHTSGPEKSSRLTLSRVFGPSLNPSCRDFFQGVMLGDSVLSLELSMKLDFVPSSTNWLRWYLFSDSDSLSGESRSVYLHLGETGGENRWQLWFSGQDTAYCLWQGNEVYSKEEDLTASFRVLYSPLDDPGAETLDWPSPSRFSLWVQSHPGGMWIQDGKDLEIDIFSLVLSSIQEHFYSGLMLRYQTASRYDQYHFGYMQVASLSESPLLYRPPDQDSIDRLDSILALRHRAPGKRSLVISEVMVEPLTGESRYVEIYNQTDTPFFLNHLVLEYWDGERWKTYPLTDNQDDSVPAYGFWVAAKDSAHIGTGPPGFVRTVCEENISTALTFPTMDPDQGWLRLLWAPLEGDTLCKVVVLDSVFYTSEAHHWLLDDTKGVSLERLDPELPALDASAWISAAETSGFATPGCENSHGFGWKKDEVEERVDGQLFWLEPRLLTPDNDGLNDYARIYWNGQVEGYACNIEVYDDWGRKMGVIARNLLLGKADRKNYIRYDGLDYQGKSLRSGIYLMYVEIIRPDGRLKRYRYAFAVG